MVFAVILVFPSRFTANIKETAPSTIETVFMSFITRFKRGKVSCHSKNSCPSGYGCHILARNECRGAVMKYNNHFLRRELCLVASYGPVLQQENLFLFNNQHKLHVSLFSSLWSGFWSLLSAAGKLLPQDGQREKKSFPSLLFFHCVWAAW